ncbi:hypothetical protein [Robertmurraya massiliosenegalensis]|uniref:hypothetical protein n=1 Tax=Robertmurraya massiliosenegalensis TaxID=1287657 RepID=UPI0002E5F660|nr:hypothetical protein [Robertmurraya massiliosenegalensis]
MESIIVKTLLIVAAIALFLLVVINQLTPAITGKGTEVQNTITNTNVSSFNYEQEDTNSLPIILT